MSCSRIQSIRSARGSRCIPKAATAGYVAPKMTMTEGIIARRAGQDSVAPGDNVWVDVDKLMTHDVCGPGTFGIFEKEFGEDAQVRPHSFCRSSSAILRSPIQPLSFNSVIPAYVSVIFTNTCVYVANFHFSCSDAMWLLPVAPFAVEPPARFCATAFRCVSLGL